MRLTLRTLLAYHDRVLGAADHEDLHRRIQQSEDAGNLLKRINLLTKRSQLLAPPLEGSGLGGDANSIAEYLDDALKGPDVPEFERICLESDTHLAELGHCHELLATALHTQIAVPNSLRDVAVRIVDPAQRSVIAQNLLTRTTKKVSRQAGDQSRIDPAHAHASGAPHGSTAKVQVQAPMVASGGESIRPEGLSLEGSALAHEVPEYLVGSTRGRWKIPLAIAVLAAMLGLLVWQALGPWQDVRALLTATPKKSPPSDVFAEDPPLTVRELVEEPAEPDTSIFHELVISNEVPPSPQAVKEPTGQPSGSTRLPETVDGATDVDVSEEAPPLPPALGESPAIETSDEAPPLPVPGDAAPVAEAPPGDTPASSTPPNDQAAPDAPTKPPLAGQGIEVQWSPVGDSSHQTVLVQQGDQLLRLAANQPIAGGTDLIIPPATRINLLCPGDILWTTSGPSRLRIDAGPNQVPMLTTTLCRGLIRSQRGLGMQVVTPLGTVNLQPADASSLLSIEMAYRRKAVGSILDRQAYVPTLVLIAAEGTAKVSSQDSTTGNTAVDVLSVGEGLALVDGQRPTKFKLSSIPRWLRVDSVPPIELVAVDDLGMLLSAAPDDATLGESLANIARNRRPETAALAIQTAVLANQWSPLVNDLLGSEQLRGHWQKTLDVARQVLAIAPSDAGEVRELFVEKYGDAAGKRYFELLCGPAADAATPEELNRLIGFLESDQLGQRILAIYQLESLTGQRFAYLPHAPNRASVQQWRREAATKRLPLLPASDPIYERGAR